MIKQAVELAYCTSYPLGVEGERAFLGIKMLTMRLCHLVSLFLLKIGEVLSNPATHVYPLECAPPDSALLPSTTPAPIDPNATFFYHGVLPIEYCCPQVNKCKKEGGFCALRWMLDYVLPDCDFRLETECRDYGCNCCIKCNQDKCSKCTQHGGNCRKKCRTDEIRDYFKKCTYQYCECCKKCEMLDECRAANGTCRANHYDCPPGTTASTGCCGGCTCCKPALQPDFTCERKTGSYCALREEDCRVGYYACFGECQASQFYNGLTSPLVGYCCSPKNAPAAGTGKRIDEFDDEMNNEAMEDIESEQLNNLAPRPLGGDRSQGDVEEVVEDQIYEEVVPLKKQEELAVDIEQSNVEKVVEEQIHEEVAYLKEKNKLNVEFASPIQEDSDSDAAIAIDEPMDISDQVLDNPMDISVDQVLDSPISDQMVDSENQVDESNGEVEKPKHHRRHKKQN